MPVLTNDRTVLGIVMKAGRDVDGDWADTDVYMQKDGTTEMNTIQGYVLALSDANEGKECQWGSYGTEVGTKAVVEDFDGYTNTNTIKAFAQTEKKTLQNDFPATYYATEGYEETNPAPDNTSGWFLPSTGQCKFWLNNRAVLLESARKATESDDYNWLDRYWSSSENGSYPASHAWFLDFVDGFVFSYIKNDDYYVRSVLAF